jgi:ubiquitin conjugation factor E4 B
LTVDSRFGGGSTQVNQPEKYGFKPRSLLRKISGVYIHLAAHSTRTQELADAVARDGRSYSDAVFAKAAGVLRKDALLPEVIITHIPKYFISFHILFSKIIV